MRNLFYCNWIEAKQCMEEGDGVLLTLGSVEQHGHHLPMGTDTILAEAFASAVCDRENLYYYPCTTYGQVWSAKDFEGTVSITPECLANYCIEAIASIKRGNPKRIFLFSFHNGNHKVIEDVLRKLTDCGQGEGIYHISLAGIEKRAKEILTTPMWNDKVWHAGELETSLMLYVAEDLVHMEKATVEFPQVPPLYGRKPIPWRSFLKTGAFGDTRAATRAKGEKLFALMEEELCSQIESVKKGEKSERD